MSIYTTFAHRCDIWAKTQTANRAGQLAASWSIESSRIKCHYIPRVAVTRTKPTAEETETVTIFLPPDTEVAYGSRLYNIVDRYGNVIEEGPMEINAILKQPGFGGKIHHLALKAKRVIES
jgi:hypothetical protein